MNSKYFKTHNSKLAKEFVESLNYKILDIPLSGNLDNAYDIIVDYSNEIVYIFDNTKEHNYLYNFINMAKAGLHWSLDTYFNFIKRNDSNSYQIYRALINSVKEFFDCNYILFCLQHIAQLNYEIGWNKDIKYFFIDMEKRMTPDYLNEYKRIMHINKLFINFIPPQYIKS